MHYTVGNASEPYGKRDLFSPASDRLRWRLTARGCRSLFYVSGCWSERVTVAAAAAASEAASETGGAVHYSCR